MKILFNDERIIDKLQIGEVIQTEDGTIGIVIEDYGVIINTTQSPVFRDTLPLNTKYNRIARIQDFKVQFHKKGSESPIKKIHKGTSLLCGDLVITSQGEQAIVVRPNKTDCELLYLKDSTISKIYFGTTHFLLKLASRDDYSLVL